MNSNQNLSLSSLKDFPPDNARRLQPTFVTVSGTSYVLSEDPSQGQLEGYVQLNTTGTAAKTITLPLGDWHSGRMIKLGIWNSTSGNPTACSVTLTSTSGIFDVVSQTFMPSFTYQIGASGYTAFEIYSKGYQWVVRQ